MEGEAHPRWMAGNLSREMAEGVHLSGNSGGGQTLGNTNVIESIVRADSARSINEHSTLICTRPSLSSEIMFKVNAPNGSFFVRDRPEAAGEYILVLMFRGKPTHHLLKESVSGIWTVNERDIGGARSLKEVCTQETPHSSQLCPI